VLLQLSQIKQPVGPATSVWLLTNTPGRQLEELEASPAHFGPAPVNVTADCISALYAAPVPSGAPDTSPPDAYKEYFSSPTTCTTQPAELPASWMATLWRAETVLRCGLQKPLLGQLVRAEPFAACGELTNPGDVAGRVAVVLRGNCSFITKVLLAQRAGALGVVVINNQGNSELIRMAGDDSSPEQPVISSVLVTRETGQRLLAWMGQQPVSMALVGNHVQPSGKEYESSTRIDMLIPVNSSPWLNANIFGKGINANKLFEQLLSEAFVLQSLMAAATNRAP
jgi:hypothetical protein